jgi:exosortase/archaeosortase family protein
MHIPFALCSWLLFFCFMRHGPTSEFTVAILCRPAVHLCGLYMNVSPEPLPGGGAMISEKAATLIVGDSCSATNFFLLTSLAMLYVSLRKRFELRLALAAIGLAYLATILLNACRILAVWKCLVLFGTSPFGIPGPLFHYLLGAATFWPALIAMPLVFKKMLENKGVGHVASPNGTD